MGAGLTNCIDSTNSYFANLISKNGRNEVQIYSICNETTTLDQVLVKVELQAEETIIGSTWTTLFSKNNQKKGKKRSNSNGQISTSNGDSQLLVVLVATGDILIFTPHHDVPFERISSETAFIGLTSNTESIWAYSQTEFYQVSPEEHTVSKKFSLSSSISIARALEYKTKSGKSSHIIIQTENGLQLIDTSKKSLVISTYKDCPENVSKVVEFTSNNDHFYVLDTNASSVLVYNTKSLSPILSWKIAGAIDIHSISNDQKEILMAITNVGVQYFDFELKSSDPLGNIKTNFEAQGIYISSIYFINRAAVGIWYDGNEPKSTKLVWNFTSSGDSEESIEYSVKLNATSGVDSLISLPEATDIHNLSSDVLYKQLVNLLLSTEFDESKIINLCESNDDPINIKETVKQFHQSEDSELLSSNLFQIVSKKVANDPSKKSSLSIWLKWLLLAYGSSIATQQSDSLVNLESGISNAMKVLPHLVALKGRLKLLQSQGTLRTLKLNEDEDDVSEDEFVGSQTAESSIVYANGENDEEDLDDIDEELVEDGEGVDDEDNEDEN